MRGTSVEQEKLRRVHCPKYYTVRGCHHPYRLSSSRGITDPKHDRHVWETCMPDEHQSFLALGRLLVLKMLASSKNFRVNNIYPLAASALRTKTTLQ